MKRISAVPALCLAGCLTSVGVSDQVTRYAAQGGQVYGNGSCCSPYTYTNSNASQFGAWGCFNAGVYGCIQSRQNAVWRWDAIDLIPEGSVVSSAQLVLRHSYNCIVDYAFTYIGVMPGVVSSGSLSSMNVLQNEMHTYSSTSLTIDLDLEVLNAAMEEGSIVAKLTNSEQNGCGFINYGTYAPRLVVTYEDLSTPCPGDLDGDGVVDGVDISMVVGHWGQSHPVYDIDGSGAVDGMELATVLGWWGSCPD